MNRYLRKINKDYCLFLSLFFPKKYKEKYPKYLRKIGINISEDYYESKHGYIAPSAVFDANDYSLISIGKATTISSDVYILTHDFSISKALKLVDPNLNGRFLKPVKIGDNSFIGLRSLILPGTEIGNNVIVGAGSVVKGKIPDNVVIAGNPAKIICSIEEFAKRHYLEKDYEGY